jgi:trigger factor
MKLRPQINNYVANAMATTAIDEIVFEKDIKIMSQPQFSNVVLNGNKFHCDISLYKRPDINLPELKFDLEKPKQEGTEDELIERSIHNLQVRVGELEPYGDEDAVDFGDNITFSFKATIEGNEFDGSIVEGEMYKVGSNRWAGFDNYIIGMKAGESREFDFIFETVSAVDSSEKGLLSGKTAHFNVEVHMGTKQKPHELNDDFFVKMGVANKEELIEKLRKITTATIKRNELNNLRQQVARKLIDSDPELDVPDAIVKQEAMVMANNSGIDTTALSDEDLAGLIGQAKVNIKLSLILDTIREQEPDAVLNPNEARSHLAQHFASQGQDPGKIFNDPRMQYQIQMMIQNVRDEFTLQWVVDKCTILE